MPRYLTPARISLLVVIDLYTSNDIPASASFDVLNFIASQVVVPSEHDNASLSERFKLSSSDITGFQEPLSRLQSEVPGRTLFDALLQRLWKLEGIDALYTLFHNLSDLIAPIVSEAQGACASKVSRSSPLGQFIRRCCVEFTRLQFDDSMVLWNSFASYRQPSYDLWSQRNPEAALQLEENQPLWAQSSPANQGTQLGAAYASVEDSDTLLSLSIQRLQKFGARVPQDVKSNLRGWVQNQSDLGGQSLQYFLSFFEHWRAGEHNMAEESLRRYFDYSLNAKGGSDNVKVYYQYAYLHLSVLHADFEFWGKSVDMMSECIASARENQDTACLNFALSWLLYLRQAHPNDESSSLHNLVKLVGGEGGESDEISFLKMKARESKHWSLMSSTLLEEAKLDMYTGGRLTNAFEHITQALYLNVHYDLRTLMPASTLFQASSLERLGQSSLSFHTYESIKLIHDAHCPLSDRVRATIRIAYNLAQNGHFQAAMETLEGADRDATGVLNLQQRIYAFKVLVQLKKHCHSEDLNTANDFFEILRGIQSSGDPEIGFELAILEVELLMKEGNLQDALRKVNAYVEKMKVGAASDVAQRLHLLVLKCRIFAAGGQSPKGFTLAMRAASTAQRYSLVPVLLEALAALAVILNDLSEFEAAKYLAEAALPHALETRDLHLTARLFSCVAESQVGIAGHVCQHKSSEQAQSIRDAEANVERSYEAYCSLSDRTGRLDCLTMRARLARWRGDELAAKQADEMHLQLLAGNFAVPQ